MRRLSALGVEHLHAHFGTNPAAVAAIVRAWGGPPFSFTVHGPDEFDAPIALSLAAKIEAAAFVVAISSYGRSQLMRWSRPSRLAQDRHRPLRGRRELPEGQTRASADQVATNWSALPAFRRKRAAATDRSLRSTSLRRGTFSP